MEVNVFASTKKQWELVLSQFKEKNPNCSYQLGYESRSRSEVANEERTKKDSHVLQFRGFRDERDF